MVPPCWPNMQKKLKSLLGGFTETYQFSSSRILVKLYKPLIRPHIEYACTVWDPHLKKDIQALENVQKFALRVCSKSWSCDCPTLLDTLSMPTLPDWRETLKLCLLSNIRTGRVINPSCPITVKTLPIPLVAVTLYNLWSPVTAPTNTNTHSKIERWNSLNFDANGCNSLNSVKYALLYY